MEKILCVDDEYNEKLSFIPGGENRKLEKSPKSLKEILDIIFSEQYEVLYAENLVEAEKLLKNNKEEIKLLIQDYFINKAGEKRRGSEIVNKLAKIKKELRIIGISGGDVEKISGGPAMSTRWKSVSRDYPFMFIPKNSISKLFFDEKWQEKILEPTISFVNDYGNNAYTIKDCSTRLIEGNKEKKLALIIYLSNRDTTTIQKIDITPTLSMDFLKLLIESKKKPGARYRVTDPKLIFIINAKVQEKMRGKMWGLISKLGCDNQEVTLMIGEIGDSIDHLNELSEEFSSFSDLKDIESENENNEPGRINDLNNKILCLEQQIEKIKTPNDGGSEVRRISSLEDKYNNLISKIDIINLKIDGIKRDIKEIEESIDA